MAYGLEIYNEDGSLQIASGVQNYVFVQKGTVSVTGAGNFTVTPTVAYDAIAVNSSNIRVAPQGIYPTTRAANTATTFRIAPDNNTVSGTINWYAFRNYNHLTPNTSGFGLEVYDSAGNVNFSSFSPHIMKATKVAITTSGLTNYTVPNKTYALMSWGVTVYAYVWNANPYQNPPAWATLFHIAGAKYTAGTLTTYVNLPFAGQSGIQGTSQYDGGVLLVDVTGY